MLSTPRFRNEASLCYAATAVAALAHTAGVLGKVDECLCELVRIGTQSERTLRAALLQHGCSRSVTAEGAHGSPLHVLFDMVEHVHCAICQAFAVQVDGRQRRVEFFDVLSSTADFPVVGGTGRRTSRHVDQPPVVLMGRWTLPTDVPGTSSCVLAGAQYRVAAVMEVRGGHCRAYLCDDKRWWEADDVATPSFRPRDDVLQHVRNQLALMLVEYELDVVFVRADCWQPFHWPEPQVGQQHQHQQQQQQQRPGATSADSDYKLLLAKARQLLPKSSEPQVRKRKSVNNETKLAIALQLEDGSSQAAVARRFGCSEHTVQLVSKQRQQLISSAAAGRLQLSAKRQHAGQASKKFEELDRRLYAWLVAKRTAALAVSVSSELLREKALTLAEELGLDNFRCSEKWLRKFKSRYGVRLRVQCGESNGVTEQQVQEGLEAVQVPQQPRRAATGLIGVLQASIQKWGVDSPLVYNADEAALFWRQGHARTLTLATETFARGSKKDKSRVTVMVCSNSTGEFRVPLFFIGKAKMPRALKGVIGRYHWKHNTKAWMTKEMFQLWMNEVFLPHVAAHHATAKRVLLFVDNCSAHPSQATTYRCGPGDRVEVVVELLPPNLTSKLQPMDAGTREERFRLRWWLTTCEQVSSTA